MTSDRRKQLLDQIHADLDDDLARSVYADHLLELGGEDAWHGELIRLQLDHAAPERMTKLLQRQTRSLGPLVRLYEVTWTRGFPERLRTRKWSREHISQLETSPHLRTIRGIEVGYMRAMLLPGLLAASDELTSRVTELNVCSPTDALLDRLLEASERFSRLRRLGLALEPMEDPIDQRLTSASLERLFESKLGAQLQVVQKAITLGELERYSALVQHAPSNLQHLELLSVNDAGDAEAATVFTRSGRGVFEPDLDPLVPMIAMLRADGDAGFESETEAWSHLQLQELGARLEKEGLRAEAKTVGDVARRRR